MGLYGSSDPLATVLGDLRAVRSGGHPWTPDEVIAALDSAGFSEATQIEHGIAAPLRLLVGSA